MEFITYSTYTQSKVYNIHTFKHQSQSSGNRVFIEKRKFKNDVQTIQTDSDRL